MDGLGIDGLGKEGAELGLGMDGIGEGFGMPGIDEDDGLLDGDELGLEEGRELC